CFTGAGISTESGIPDFRSLHGLWSRYDPNEYATIDAFITHPEKYWTMHNEVHNDFQDVKPNKGHYALVELEKLGKLHAIITQNIDNLHQTAGSKVPVLELHGNYNRAYCYNCKKDVDFEDLNAKVKQGHIPPYCDECGTKGPIKPDVILFGEALPMEVLEAATLQTRLCDAMLIVGSSLSVYPAAYVPVEARARGASLILVNDEPTVMDANMSVRLIGKAGKILPKIVKEVKNIL
ncbi:MAG: NAD-dependent deacetylase, partial [Candidatus Hodarchaeota archaeon]